MKQSIYLALIAMVASGCTMGYWIPNAQNHFGAQTTVVLDKANFRVVKNVEAVIEVNNSNPQRGDVEKSAYAELLRAANLTGSQVLTNVIVDEVRRDKSFLRFFNKTQQYVAARATVIEFLDETGNPIPSLPTFNQEDTTIAETIAEKDVVEYTEQKQFLIQINEEWEDYVLNLATRLNNNEKINPIYDLNEDGIVSVEELNEINNMFKYAQLEQDVSGTMTRLLKNAHQAHSKSKK